MINLSVQFTPNGPVAPTYATILATLQDAFRSIYGNDIYIDDDSQDGQLIAIYASSIKNANDSAIAAYNNQSPATAQGVGLSTVVKINGIARLVPTNGQVVQRVVGQVGQRINDGLVANPNTTGQQWALPAVVIIPPAGFIDVTATALDAGNIAAETGTLTYIVNPQRGWQSTTNISAATPGEPVEVDATLRKRQASSTALPALSVKDALVGAIKALAGVGRATVYENDTSTTDADGIPEHSVSAVVEGGDVQAIGDTIELYKTPGTGTYGDIAVDVVDPKGLPNVINFFELTLVTMGVLAYLTAETGYVSTTGDLVTAALSAWFNGLDIGQDSQLNKLWSPVNLSGDVAVNTSGQTQEQLDVLSNTYNPTALYQARLDDMVLTLLTAAGNNTFHVGDAANYAIGSLVAIVLDDGSILRTVVTNKVGLVLTTLANVPGGRTAPIGKVVYVSGDVNLLFNEAAAGVVADILLEVS